MTAVWVLSVRLANRLRRRKHEGDDFKEIDAQPWVKLVENYIFVVGITVASLLVER